MSSRDDFPAPVKRLLAARAGHRCSNPRCRTQTSGPQLDEAGSVNLGVAAHVTAAAKGGPRYDSTLTAEERGGLENGVWLCQNCAKLIDSDVKRYSARVLWGWKEQAETAASEEIGQAASGQSSSAQEDSAAEIRQRLELRDTLQQALLRLPEQRRGEQRVGRVTHPYEKFRRHKVIVRSLDDKSYPEIAESTGISSWFRVEPYDFYHNGLEVILKIQHVIMNGEGQWRPISYDESYDESAFRRVKVWVIGRIPFQFIRAYDLQGDDYYRDPHLYCAFANDGEPYEAIRYATVGEDDSYDWPLDDKLRIPASERHESSR